MTNQMNENPTTMQSIVFGIGVAFMNAPKDYITQIQFQSATNTLINMIEGS